MNKLPQPSKRRRLGRLGTPEDAANSIYLMCAPESDWITGEVILASGGVRS